MRFTNSILIHQPVEKVFSFVSNFENSPKWNYAVITCERSTSGPLGLGHVFNHKRQFLGRVLEESFSISRFEHNARVTIESLEARYPFIMEYSFEPRDSNTLLINLFELRTTGPFRLAEFLLRPKVNKAVNHNLHALKSLLESNP
ncbi:MAG: SRPBCC family protein [Bacteroidota bacterium]